MPVNISLPASSASRTEFLKREAQRREERLKALMADPYMGPATLEEALANSKCSTQAEVLARLLSQENVFVSGLAGSGKTTVVNRFVEILEAQFNGNIRVALTASTGIAATLIGGRTIHSWSGLGISEEPFNSEKLERGVRSRKEEMQEAHVLVIDEISMLPAYFFTKLDLTLQHVRSNTKPFGGIQLVLLGDFLQLPPVKTRHSDPSVDYRYAIETQSWQNANVRYCFMDKSQRASDERLRTILTEMARGKVSQESRELIQSRQGATLKHAEDKVFTTLFTTNMNVDKFNDEKLAAIKGRTMSFKCLYREGDTSKLKELVKRTGMKELLELKVGATVMLTKNLSADYYLANGSLGKVVSFNTEGDPVIKFNEGITVSIERAVYDLHGKPREVVNPVTKKKETMPAEAELSYMQYPLRLAFAITVHKSQGQTFNGITADLSKCFIEGLGYVALSRVRSLDDLIVTGMSEKAWRVDERSKKITLFVKRQALKNREHFMENQEDYDLVLTSEMARRVYWNSLAEGIG